MSFWKNTVDVSVQDQTTEAIELYLHRSTGNVTLSGAVAEGAYVINLVAGHGVTTGDYICIREGTRWYQGKATNVATNAITLNIPLDFNVTTAALLHKGPINMASAAGSQAAPMIYTVSPPVGVKWDITHLALHLLDGTEMDDAKFGGITALTNGCVLRVIDGYTKNILCIRDNSEIFLHGDDTNYSTKAPSGKYGFFSIKRLGGQDNMGVVARLSGSTGDRIEMVIQDDLTNLDEMHVLAMGHKVND